MTNDEDDTFLKLRMGDLEARRARLTEQIAKNQLEQNLRNYDEFYAANRELLDIHAEMIAIYKEEAAKIDMQIEIERRK